MTVYILDTSPMLRPALGPAPPPVPEILGPADTPRGVLWKWLLADSALLEAGILGALSGASSRQLTLALNKPGSATWRLSMLDQMAHLIQPITTSLLAYKRDVDNSVWKLVWSGPVWTIQEDLPDAHMSVTATGWLELLNHRLLRGQIIYGPELSLTGGQIVQNLLSYTNAIKPTRILPGANTDVIMRSRSYDRWQNIGSAIQELSDVEAGFDYRVNPSTRKLDIYGSVHSDGSANLDSPLQLDRPDAVFGYGWGPDNVAQFTRILDSSTLMNRLDVSGKFATFAYPEPDDVDDTSDTYGLFEEQVALQDVVNDDILQAYAVSEVEFRNQPRVTYQVTPFPANERGGRVPRPCIDYDVGHRVYLRARHGKRVRVGETEPFPVRVFGMTIGIDEEDNEKLGPLTLSAS